MIRIQLILFINKVFRDLFYYQTILSVYFISRTTEDLKVQLTDRTELSGRTTMTPVSFSRAKGEQPFLRGAQATWSLSSGGVERGTYMLLLFIGGTMGKDAHSYMYYPEMVKAAERLQLWVSLHEDFRRALSFFNQQIETDPGLRPVLS